MAHESNETSKSEQKGPQQHAEGQHGEKTHERFLEQLGESRNEPDPMEPEGLTQRERKRGPGEDR